MKRALSHVLSYASPERCDIKQVFVNHFFPQQFTHETELSCIVSEDVIDSNPNGNCLFVTDIHENERLSVVTTSAVRLHRKGLCEE